MEELEDIVDNLEDIYASDENLYDTPLLEEMTEKEKFVAATIDAACYTLGIEDILDPVVQNNLADIYENYGLNEETITELTTQYAEDEEIQTAIQEGIEQCTPEDTNDADDSKKKRR